MSDRPECWIFLSADLPLPLRGRHRCRGSANAVADWIDQAITSGGRLVVLTLMQGDEHVQVHVNPAHIVAVMP